MFGTTTSPSARADILQVYIGTYTGPKSQGIYRSAFDTTTGKLWAAELAAQTRNPTFLAMHPNGRWLYAVNEVSNFGSERSGSVSALSIGPDRKLKLLNQQPSGGSGPCHLAVDKTGKCLLVANYGSGSAAALPIESDGKVKPATSIIQHQGSSVNRQRQSGPHAHFITTDPNNRYALACDLGLDKVLVYRLERAGCTLTPNEPPSFVTKPGAGPRHLAFHPKGRFVYLLQELTGAMTVLGYDPERGQLNEVQTLPTLPDDFKGSNLAAEVQVHPSGRFLYSSNRGHDSIAVFAVDAATGKLSFVERQSTKGKAPRHFTLDPTGKWLLAENQDSNNIVVFRVDSDTGRITPTGESIEVTAPVCAVFGPRV